MSIVRVVLLGVLVAVSWTPLMAAVPDERYIIKFAPGAEETVRGAIKQNRGRIKRALSNRRLLAATLPPGALRALKARADITLVEVDPKRYPHAQSTPYGISMVQAAAGGLAEGSVNPRKVCIIDTGYDLGHEDLPNNEFEVLITGDSDCGPGCGPSTDWQVDGYGHGTHVAGTIVALRDNNLGVVGINASGQLPVHMVKVFNDQGQWAYGSDLIKAIDQCVLANANVVNMSLGGPTPSTAEETAFAGAYAANDMLFVASAGNDGNASLSYPASYDSVVSVAAIDSDKDAASFSQYNSQVEIAAPGVAVNSTLPGNNYAQWDGTSMASPHVAGVAALVWGHHNCTAEQVRAALVAGAEQLGGPGRNSSYGYGLVQAMDTNMLLHELGCSAHWPPNEGYVTQAILNNQVAGQIATATRGDEYHYDIEVPPGAADLRILIYDADPGANGGTGDADLHVVAPATNQAYPASDVWDCRPYINGSSETCVEDNPVDGTWRIMLRAFSDFTNVAVKASYTDMLAGGTPNDYHLPDADLPVAGTVSPSFADLSDNDGVMQTITEVSSGGKPKNRTSKAEHRWRIPGVTSGESVTLQIVAAGTDNGEGDSFTFDVSYDDGGNWAPVCEPLREGGALQRYECVLQNTTTGTVLVRARDDSRTGGNLVNDVLYVDQLQIVTANPNGGPVEPPPPQPPPDLVLTASGEKRKGKIWVTLDWTPASPVTIHRSIDGAPETNEGPGSGGTYVDNTRLKGSPVIDYYVCESPAPVPANCSDPVTVTF